MGLGKVFSSGGASIFGGGSTGKMSGLMGMGAMNVLGPFSEQLGLGQESQTQQQTVQVAKAGVDEKQLFQQALAGRSTGLQAPVFNPQNIFGNQIAGQMGRFNAPEAQRLDVPSQVQTPGLQNILPSQQDIGFGQQTAQQLFAPQRQALDESF